MLNSIPNTIDKDLKIPQTPIQSYISDNKSQLS